MTTPPVRPCDIVAMATGTTNRMGNCMNGPVATSTSRIAIDAAIQCTALTRRRNSKGNTGIL